MVKKYIKLTKCCFLCGVLLLIFCAVCTFAMPVNEKDESSRWMEFMHSVDEMVSHDKDIFLSSITLNLEEKKAYDCKGRTIDELPVKLLTDALRQDDGKAVAGILENSQYDILFSTGKNVVIIDAACTQRIILEAADIKDNYGAEKTIAYNNIHLFQYNSIERTQNAYKKLCKDFGEDRVSYDRILPFPEGSETIEEVREELAESEISVIPPAADSMHFDWGAYLMELPKLKHRIENSGLATPDVVVAVIDVEGFNVTNLNTVFSNRLVNGRNYYQASGTEIIETAYNFGYETEEGHGSKVASVVLKSTTDNICVLPIQVHSYIAAAAAIGYCAEKGVDIVNMSYTAGYNNSVLRNFYDTAINNAITYTSNRILFFAAAGNHFDENYYYPSSAPNVISVSGVQQNENDIGIIERWAPKMDETDGSTCNYLVDYCGPARDIDVFSGTLWKLGNGTSFATPYLASAAAMIRTVKNNYSKDEVEDVLYSCAVDIGPNGKDKYFGWGYVVLTDFIDSCEELECHCGGCCCTCGCRLHQ